MVVCTSEDLFV